MTDDRKLRMSFDTNTIGHLGISMYSNLPNALAELIANAYDADATRVDIKLYDDNSEKRIEVQDNGIGMSFDDINSKFLRIARNRRRHEESSTSLFKRKVTGKKGLGKLALFGLVNRIKITTIKKVSGKKINFEMNWADINNTNDESYSPEFEEIDCSCEEKGTSIYLYDLNRKSGFKKDDLAISLSKLFNFFDEGFKCFITLNDDDPTSINNDLKIQNLDKEFEWSFPDDSIVSEYEHKNKVYGTIISTVKPLKSDLRGITLFANGRMVNAPEFFNLSESSHVFSYLTGFLNVDFVDEFEEDLISTNRQSLNWTNEKIQDLKEYISKIIRKVAREWRDKRQNSRRKKIITNTEINEEEWIRTLQPDKGENIKKILDAISEDEGVDENTQKVVVSSILELVPQYAEYHWRHLHPKIQEASLKYYRDKNYYTACLEAIKSYIKCIRMKSKFNQNMPEHDVIEGGGANLDVTNGFLQPDGTPFSASTLKNIKCGYRYLSMGVYQGCRHVLSHEEINSLKESNLFNEKDCLDTLSILSHLFRRLDKAKLSNGQ